MSDCEHSPEHACCGGKGACGAKVDRVESYRGPRRTFKVQGMCCAEEVATLKRALRGFIEDDRLGFDVLSGKMTVPVDSDLARIQEAVASTGMKATLCDEGTTDSAPPSPGPLKALTLGSGLLLAVGFGLHVAFSGITEAVGSEGAGLVHLVPWPVRLVYLGAILAGLRLVLPKAAYALRSARPDMNLLMCVAVSGAIFLDEWFEAATVSFLFALSLMLESWSAGRARKAVAALLSLAPDQVRVVRPSRAGRCRAERAARPGAGDEPAPRAACPHTGRIPRANERSSRLPSPLAHLDGAVNL